MSSCVFSSHSEVSELGGPIEFDRALYCAIQGGLTSLRDPLSSSPGSPRGSRSSIAAECCSDHERYGSPLGRWPVPPCLLPATSRAGYSLLGASSRQPVLQEHRTEAQVLTAEGGWTTMSADATPDSTANFGDLVGLMPMRSIHLVPVGVRR